MRARSPRKSWLKWLNKPIGNLAEIEPDLDLIDSPQDKIELAWQSLRTIVSDIVETPGIKEMATSKVLYLLRPKLIAITDSYVVATLKIDGESSVETFMSVQSAIRELGKHNLQMLDSLAKWVIELHLDLLWASCGKIEKSKVLMSKNRILDILIWSDMALHGWTPNKDWAQWYQERR